MVGFATALPTLQLSKMDLCIKSAGVGMQSRRASVPTGLRFGLQNTLKLDS